MIQKILIGLNLIIGLGGVVGGFLALSSSTRTSVGISETMLKNSPFTTFLIPGLFLLCMIGFGNLLVSYTSIKAKPLYAYFDCVIGLILCLWIIAQCIMLLSIVPLHVIFFLLGFVQFLGGLLLIRKEHLLPSFSAHQN